LLTRDVRRPSIKGVPDMYKVTRTWSLIGLVLLVSVPVYGDDDIAAAVDAAESAFNQAYADNDIETYFSFYADDATLMTTDGQLQPVQVYYDEWKALINAGGGVVEVDPNHPRTIRVIDDNTVIVLFNDFPGTYRYPTDTAGAFTTVTNVWTETDVWSRIDGEWKVVHIHFHDAVTD
jgi:ketosteroid isomerase-like protein